MYCLLRLSDILIMWREYYLCLDGGSHKYTYDLLIFRSSLWTVNTNLIFKNYFKYPNQNPSTVRTFLAKVHKCKNVQIWREKFVRKVLNSDANYRLGWFFRNEKKCVKRFRLWALFAIATCGLISEMHFLEIGFHNVVNHKNSKSKFVTVFPTLPN